MTLQIHNVVIVFTYAFTTPAAADSTILPSCRDDVEEYHKGKCDENGEDA